MTSIGVQAQISDPEGVLGLVTSFHSQLMQLVEMSKSLVELNILRGEGVQQCEGIVQDLEGSMQGLARSAADMENMLHENGHVLEDTDSQLEQLTNMRERLDSQIRELEEQTNGGGSEDIDNEQRLAGFAVEELHRKIDTLAKLHQRLDQANHDKQQEWTQFKCDINQHQEDLQPFLKQKEHLEELTLARYVGMQSLKGAEDSERDLAQRMCDHKLNKALHRQLQQQLLQSEMKQQDLEDEIGGLIKQKRDLWKRCLDLENCLDELKGTSDEGHTLHPTRVYTDLPFVSEGQPDEEESDSGQDEEEEMTQTHPFLGRMLHRCPKSTNIVVGPYVEDEASGTGTEIQTMAEDTEETRLDSSTKEGTSAEAPATSDEQPSMAETAPEQDHQDAEGVTDQSRTDQQARAVSRHIAGGEVHHNTSMVTKLRKRMGLGGRHSSSTRVKGRGLSATGSFRALTKDAFSRRRRN